MKFDRKVIDSHYHIGGWFNAEGKDFWTCTEAYAEARGYHAINLNSVPSVRRDVSLNIMCALYKLRHPETYSHGGMIYDVYPVPAVMTEGMDPLTQYRELLEIGFDGIKLLESKPTSAKVLGRPLCDELYEPFFAAAEQDNTHILWHSGDPESFWDPVHVTPRQIERGWYYGDGTFLTCEEIYQIADKVLQRHPNLKVTFAHFFFLSNFSKRLEQDFLNKYPNLNVDLTPGIEMYESFGKDPAYFRDFFIRHSDRLEYGTDSNTHFPMEFNLNLCDPVYEFLTTDHEIDAWEYHFKGLDLPEDVLDKIFYGNYERRVSEKPKAINTEALKAYVAKYRHLIQDEQVRSLIDEEMKKI